MPGFNGTGPAGMGSMTGGGRGYCNPSQRAYGPATAGGPGYFGPRGAGYTDVDLVVASEEALDLVLAGAEDTGEALAGVELILLLEDGMGQPTMPLTVALTP